MCTKDMDNDDPCNCLREILRVILVLQKNAIHEERCLDTCDRKFLGREEECEEFNTRPITLYTAFSNGETPWRMPISKDPRVTALSSVFRIEKIDECCCTFRVLKPVLREPDCDEEIEYVATDSFFTINLSCICCIKCLDDTFVECL